MTYIAFLPARAIRAELDFVSGFCSSPRISFPSKTKSTCRKPRLGVRRTGYRSFPSSTTLAFSTKTCPQTVTSVCSKEDSTEYNLRAQEAQGSGNEVSRRAQAAEGRVSFSSTSTIPASASVSCPQYCRSARLSRVFSSEHTLEQRMVRVSYSETSCFTVPMRCS